MVEPVSFDHRCLVTGQFHRIEHVQCTEENEHHNVQNTHRTQLLYAKLCLEPRYTKTSHFLLRTHQHSTIISALYTKVEPTEL